MRDDSYWMTLSVLVMLLGAAASYDVLSWSAGRWTFSGVVMGGIGGRPWVGLVLVLGLAALGWHLAR